MELHSQDSFHYRIASASYNMMVLFFCFSLFSLNSHSLNSYDSTVNGDTPVQVKRVIPTYVPRFSREKPVIAIVGENSYTEITDYIIPYGVLVESGVAEVYALGMRPEPIRIFPTQLHIKPQASVAEFDVKHPKGADYVIVPAVHYDDDPALIHWVQVQASKGATIIGVCDGVWVLANAGLLNNLKAVGHWYSKGDLKNQFPTTQWLKDTRYIADKNIITTTGVTASIPVSIELVKAIAGRERAVDVAKRLGLKSWNNKHISEQFILTNKFRITAAYNWMAFWLHEDIGIELNDGVDEIAFSLLADAYSRTYLSTVVPFSIDDVSITTKRGLTFLLNEQTKVDRILNLSTSTLPLATLDNSLKSIARLYGSDTADFVALQLEYPFESQLPK